jgi:hypothetical protein
VSNYYVHIQSPTMVVPQTKVSFLITTLISGPKQADNDIDIFFTTIDGGHAETLGIWGHYVG